MRCKTVLVLLSILVIFNSALFPSLSQQSQTEPSAEQPPGWNDLTDLWKDWVNQHTETIAGNALEAWEKRESLTELDNLIFTEAYISVREQLTAQAAEMEKQFPSPYDMKEYTIEIVIENTGPEKHFGTQTVEALMESFHKEYNFVKYPLTKVRGL